MRKEVGADADFADLESLLGSTVTVTVDSSETGTMRVAGVVQSVGHTDRTGKGFITFVGEANATWDRHAVVTVRVHVPYTAADF